MTTCRPSTPPCARASPAPPPAKPGPPTPPIGLVHPPRSAHLRDLLRHGLVFTVTVSKPCKANLILLVNRKVVARGDGLALKPGDVSVLVRPTAAGRRQLRRAHRLRAQVNGDLRDGASPVFHLAVKPFARRS